MAYTLDSPISAGTVLPDNFTLTYGGKTVETKNIMYYPAKKLLHLETDFVSAAGVEYVSLSAANIYDTSGVRADFSGKAALLRTFSPAPDSVSATAVYCLCGGEPVYNLSGKTNVTVVVRAANPTAADVSGLTVKVYDGSVLAAEAGARVAAEDFEEITIDTGSHTFSSNSPTIVIE